MMERVLLFGGSACGEEGRRGKTEEGRGARRCWSRPAQDKMEGWRGLR